MVSINMFKEETIKREVDMTYPKDLLEKFYKGFIKSNNILIRILGYIAMYCTVYPAIIYHKQYSK